MVGARRSVPSAMLMLAGAGIFGIGVYFILFRPALLTEDVRYLQASPQQIEAIAPSLSKWLRYVFCVAGGYMVASGLLTIYVAATSFRSRTAHVTIVVALAGLVSIGLMSAVNFIIDSDFKWFLGAVALLWALAIGTRAWFN